MNKIQSLGIGLIVVVICASMGVTVSAQDDPATQSSLMEETLKTIKEVENLNQYIAENKALKDTNKGLQGQIASLSKQVKQLTQQLKTSTETTRKQLLALPEFKVKSKLVGKTSAIAVLDMGGKVVRIRDKVEMSVPVVNGAWTLMRVEKITKDVIELKFIELDRTITIYN